MQQKVSSAPRRAAPRKSAAVSAPTAPRRKVTLPAKIFYLMRWTYHFITPIGMGIILWGVIESATGDPDRGLPIIIGGALFTYLANYFNKAR